MAKVCFVPGSGTLAAYLSGEIDHHAAQSIRREIDAQVDDRLPELLTLDFSGVTFMDSSGVGWAAHLGPGRPPDRAKPATRRAPHAGPGPHNLRVKENCHEDAQSGKDHLCQPFCQ
jgi:hypothetical protein